MAGVTKKMELSLNFKVVLSHFGSAKTNNVMPVSDTVKKKGIDACPPALLDQMPKLLLGLFAFRHITGSSTGEKLYL